MNKEDFGRLIREKGEFLLLILLSLNLVFGFYTAKFLKTWQSKISTEWGKTQYLSYLLKSLPSDYTTKNLSPEKIKASLKRLNINPKIVESSPFGTGVQIKGELNLKDLARLLNWLEKRHYKVIEFSMEKVSEKGDYSIEFIIK